MHQYCVSDTNNTRAVHTKIMKAQTEVMKAQTVEDVFSLVHIVVRLCLKRPNVTSVAALIWLTLNKCGGNDGALCIFTLVFILTHYRLNSFFRRFSGLSQDRLFSSTDS